MWFGTVAIAQAEGAILAHAVHHAAGRLPKGRVVTTSDIELLKRSGIEMITVARLESWDLPEDMAATRIGARLAGAGLKVSSAFTGRVNLIASVDGLATIEATTINALNRVSEAVTVATLPPYTAVLAGQIVATIKIIPFGVPEKIIADMEWMLAGAGPVAVSAWVEPSASLIQTTLSGTRPTILDKSVEVTRERLATVRADLVDESRVEHAEEPLTAAIKAATGDLILIIGASAITDRRDVIPAALAAAGGEVTHFGMPVDPGNLLLLGSYAGRPVLGMPGCARSPKLNGVDWILQRLAAGIPVDAAAIMGMGVGGLLADIPGRPLPRDLATAIPRAPRVAGLILAGGFGRRMGGEGNKLLRTWLGKPLVRHVAEAATAAQFCAVTVATGHEAGAVQAALAGLPVAFAHADDHADGLSATLKAGLAALPPDIDGVMVLLGDMPKVGTEIINRIIAAFSPDDGRTIIVPAFQGQRGNPVLWATNFIPEMQQLSGDVGARGVLLRHADQITEVEVASDGILLDVDTPDALATL